MSVDEKALDAAMLHWENESYIHFDRQRLGECIEAYEAAKEQPGELMRLNDRMAAVIGILVNYEMDVRVSGRAVMRQQGFEVGPEITKQDCFDYIIRQKEVVELMKLSDAPVRESIKDIVDWRVMKAGEHATRSSFVNGMFWAYKEIQGILYGKSEGNPTVEELIAKAFTPPTTQIEDEAGKP
jgi:hypothetical protein